MKTIYQRKISGTNILYLLFQNKQSGLNFQIENDSHLLALIKNSSILYYEIV